MAYLYASNAVSAPSAHSAQHGIYGQPLATLPPQWPVDNGMAAPQEYVGGMGSGSFTASTTSLNPTLNPTARPFVSSRSPVATSGCPVDAVKSPLTPGKRMHNPYAAVALNETPDMLPQSSYEATTGSFHSYAGSSMTVSPVSPAVVPAAFGWGQQQMPMGLVPSPIAAPLPTTLPQRDGSMMFSQAPRGAQGRGYSNQAGPHQQQHNNNNGGHGPALATGQPVSLEEALAQQGNYLELARTANGSSFIQAAVREGSDPSNLPLIWAELYPALGDLLLDAHGCYVIKSVMERLPPEELTRAVTHLAADPQLVFSMCTHSLHTRRVVQYLLDSVECGFITELLTACVAEIAMTQQGCIVMQRAMDVATGPSRASLFNGIYANLVRFSMDPFANYVVQHLLEVGDVVTNSLMFRQPFLSHVIELSCNKFASNVMEKALFHLDEALQHDILMAIYSSGEDTLFRMLQDSFGNYLIQSSIALAPFNDVYFISEKLRPVLQRTPYGHKIEGRLERRLKGKSVGTRSPAIGSTFKGNAHHSHNNAPHSSRRGQHHGGSNFQQQQSFGGSGSSYSGSDNGESTTQAEEPW